MNGLLQPLYELEFETSFNQFGTSVGDSRLYRLRKAGRWV